MKKTAQNCGWGRCYNYDMRRLDVHGGGGACNSEARKQVLEWEILGEEVRGRTIEEVLKRELVGEEKKGGLC